MNFISHTDQYNHLKNIGLSPESPNTAWNDGTSEKRTVKYTELIVDHLV